jgi:hypothetical protein
MSFEPYSSGALRKAYRASGLDLKTLSWRSKVVPNELAKVLRGKHDARVDVLLEIAFQLGFRLMIESAIPAQRLKNPVPSVTDKVRDSLQAGLAPRQTGP